MPLLDDIKRCIKKALAILCGPNASCTYPQQRKEQAMDGSLIDPSLDACPNHYIDR